VRHTFNFSALYALPFGKGSSHDFGSVGNALLGNWEIGGIINARSGLPLEIGITRPDVVIQCAAATCPVTINGVTTTVPTGFVAQLPGTINATNPLPVGFVGVVNTPGGGASRNVRRPNIVPGVNPYLNVALKLPRTEFLIFSRLVRTPDRIVTSDDLWTCVWATNKPLNSESLHVYIYRLRAKLAEFGLQIETMVNVGYRVIVSKKA